ncbi:MAG: peptidylprolyl isomerase [Ruminococcus sp.]|nr:peptidylprolyl isomerase [Ruminococcus sp.]
MKKTNAGLRLILIMAFLTAVFTAVVLFFSSAHAKNDTYVDIDPETVKLVQLDPPKEGDPIAIVDTDLGEFRMRLYPEYSPEAVKNFTELAESGYYNDTYVFDSGSGAFASMGAPQKNGELPVGYDTTREDIPRELHQDLWPIRGTVMSLARAGKRGIKEVLLGGTQYYSGSRFLVVDTIKFTPELEEELREISTIEGLGDAFIGKGGVPNFSQQMTIIGQTYEGFEVIDALSSLESKDNGAYHIPVEDVKIKTVTIGTYSEGSDK